MTATRMCPPTRGEATPFDPNRTIFLVAQNVGWRLARIACWRRGVALESETNSRSEGRSNVFLSATIETGEASNAVRIRNLSCRGALVEGAMLPSVGADVRLRRGSLSAKGVLAWEGNRQGGVSFDRPIDVKVWVQRVGHGGQQRVDTMVEATRGYHRLPDDWQDALATQNLATISAALDEVCERLSRTENMSLELAEDLLRLDAIAQYLRNATR
jgi:hypothetical protein